MKNVDNRRNGECRGHAAKIGIFLLAGLLSGLLAGCGKAPGRMPSPGPHRPQVSAAELSSHVHKAILTWSRSSGPAMEFQDGRGIRLERHLIMT
jgi:hypothetical protein